MAIARSIAVPPSPDAAAFWADFLAALEPVNNAGALEPEKRLARGEAFSVARGMRAERIKSAADTLPAAEVPS